MGSSGCIPSELSALIRKVVSLRMRTGCGKDSHHPPLLRSASPVLRPPSSPWRQPLSRPRAIRPPSTFRLSPGRSDSQDYFQPFDEGSNFFWLDGARASFSTGVAEAGSPRWWPSCRARKERAHYPLDCARSVCWQPLNTAHTSRCIDIDSFRQSTSTHPQLVAAEFRVGWRGAMGTGLPSTSRVSPNSALRSHTSAAALAEVEQRFSDPTSPMMRPSTKPL